VVSRFGFFRGKDSLAQTTARRLHRLYQEAKRQDAKGMLTTTTTDHYTAITGRNFELTRHANPDDPALPTYQLRWGRHNRLSVGVNPAFDVHPTNLNRPNYLSQVENLRQQANQDRFGATQELIRQIESTKPPLPDTPLMLQLGDQVKETRLRKEHLDTMQQLLGQDLTSLERQHGPIETWPQGVFSPISMQCSKQINTILRPFVRLNCLVISAI
jgi:hypothetical protein